MWKNWDYAFTGIYADSGYVQWEELTCKLTLCQSDDQMH